jgi:hypothetical protein
MSGIMQCEYRIPKGRCPALLDDLHGAGMLRSPGFQLPHDGIMIFLQSPRKLPLSIDFSECEEGDQERRVTISWAPIEKAIAAKLEAAIRRSGGVPVAGAVLEKL